MKILRKYCRPFRALLLVCALLMVVEGVCGLLLPGFWERLAEEGLRQNGMTAGAPEAMSRQGTALLESFLSEEDRELLAENYFTIAPGSSEAQRLSVQYPLVREESISLLREGLSPETRAQTDAAYDRGAYALFLYLRRAAETGELRDVARRLTAPQGENRGPGEFRSNVRDFDKPESSYPEGVIGEIPEEALFSLPESAATPRPEESASEESAAEEELQTGEATMGSAQKNFGAARPETDAADDGYYLGMDLTRFDGFAGRSAQQLYSLLPLIAQAPEESIRAAREQALQDPEAAARVAVALKRPLYEELGVNVKKMRDEAVWRHARWLLLFGLLGLAAGVTGGWLSRAAAVRVSGQLRKDLSPSPSLSYGAGEVRLLRRFLSAAPRLFCWAPVVFAGGTVLALKNGGGPLRTAGLCLCLALTAAAFVLPGLPAPAPFFGRVEKALSGRELWPLPAFAPSALLPAALPVGLLYLRSRAAAASAAAVGSQTAYGMILLLLLAGGLLLAVLRRLLPKAMEADRKLGAVLEQTETEGAFTKNS